MRLHNEMQSFRQKVPYTLPEFLISEHPYILCLAMEGNVAEITSHMNYEFLCALLLYRL